MAPQSTERTEAPVQSESHAPEKARTALCTAVVGPFTPRIVHCCSGPLQAPPQACSPRRRGRPGRAAPHRRRWARRGRRRPPAAAPSSCASARHDEGGGGSEVGLREGRPSLTERPLTRLEQKGKPQAAVATTSGDTKQEGRPHLAASRLPVREHARIVAVQRGADERRNVGVHVLVRRRWTQHAVEEEGLAAEAEAGRPQAGRCRPRRGGGGGCRGGPVEGDVELARRRRRALARVHDVERDGPGGSGGGAHAAEDAHVALELVDLRARGVVASMLRQSAEAKKGGGGSR